MTYNASGWARLRLLRKGKARPRGLNTGRYRMISVDINMELGVNAYIIDFLKLHKPGLGRHVYELLSECADILVYLRYNTTYSLRD